MYDMKIKTFNSGRRVFVFSDKPIMTESEKFRKKIDVDKPSKKIDFGDDFENESKSRSLRRTKQAIYDLAFANDWEYFLTVTFDIEKVDRYNYDDVVKRYSKKLDNLKQRHFSAMEYVMVPERHDDGAYHFHGLIKGIPKDAFQTALNARTGKKLKVGGRLIYNCLKFDLGYNTFSSIGDSEKASTYLSKYITKTLVDELKGKKKYWCSRGLAKPVVETHFIGQELKEDVINAILNSGSLASVVDKSCKFADFENHFTYIVTQPGIDENYILRRLLASR